MLGEDEEIPATHSRWWAPLAEFGATEMSTISGDGSLHGIAKAIARMAKLSPSERRAFIEGSKSLDATKSGQIVQKRPTAAELAEQNAYKAQVAKMEADFKKRQEEVEASNHLNNNDMHLPNITNLSLESAIKMKGFVEVDIEQGLDGVGNIYGHYGDKQVSSLKEYLSLITDYINSKSASSTPASSTQPSTPTETPSPATSPAPTTPVASAPTAATPTASEPVAGADPNWIDPVGKPGQNHIFFPNVASLSRETAAAVYKQVSSMVKTQDVSQSVIHAHNGSAGTYSVDTYMSWLAQRAATNILA